MSSNYAFIPATLTNTEEIKTEVELVQIVKEKFD